MSVSPGDIVDAGTAIGVAFIGWVARRISKWTDRLEKKVDDGIGIVSAQVSDLDAKVDSIDVRCGRVEGAVGLAPRTILRPPRRPPGSPAKR